MDGEQARAQWARVDALLDRALALPAERRRAWIEAETVADPRLRAEVLVLLAECETRDDLLDRPALDALSATVEAAELPAGARIGPFRLNGLLGRGGMGEVYRAQRDDGQFEREVALKLLRPDAVGHLGRFIAERQILARLEHPGIARLYDAGVAGDGRPYMVMELVEGRPITDWCREHGAGLRERLRLFLQVCDAVAHAHQNLVVHRDIKPGNVFVNREGQTRLLDFGVAKRLGDGAEATRDTPMTLAYAAPEQLRGEPATTASDIYALGALLFELTTGRMPWPVAKLPIAVAIERLLHEPVPRASQVAGGDATLPPPRALAGDIDSIIDRAMAKAPQERYATVVGLARDVRNHLAGEPVIARVASRGYRVRHALRRYRWPIAATGALLVALSLGLAGTTWQMREAARERDIARSEAERSDAVRDYLMLMFREAGDEASEGDLTAKQVLERSAAQLTSGRGRTPARQEVFQVLGELYAALDDYEGAAPIFRHYLASAGPDADPALRAEIRHNLAIAEFRLGNAARARALLAAAQRFWNTDPPRYRDSLAISRSIESQLQRDAGDVDGAIATLRAGLAERLAISGRGHRETAYVMNALALALMQAGQLPEADEMMGQALAILASLGRQDTANALTMLSNQAVVAAMRGDHARAEPLFERAVELRRKLYGRSGALAALQQNLGRLMVRSGRAAQALPLLEDALDMAREFNGAQSPLALTVQLSVAEAHLAVADDGAEAKLLAARDDIGRHFGREHVLYARSGQLLARLRASQGRRADALAALDQSDRLLTAMGPAGAPYLAESGLIRTQLDALSRR